MIVVANKPGSVGVFWRYTNSIFMEFVWQKGSFLCVGRRIETHRKSLEWEEMKSNGI